MVRLTASSRSSPSFDVRTWRFVAVDGSSLASCSIGAASSSTSTPLQIAIAFATRLRIGSMIAARPPGTYRMSSSQPADDAASVAASKGRNAGRPKMYSAPINGPASRPTPPMTVIATMSIDSPSSKFG